MGRPRAQSLPPMPGKQLIEMIRQNYNHPSIAVWSIANEVDLTADPDAGARARRRRCSSPSISLPRKEDPTRFTTMADCCETAVAPHGGRSDGRSLRPRDAIVGIADTVGYNRYFGWYAGRFEDFRARCWIRRMRATRQLPMAVSEYGGGRGAQPTHR